MKDQIKVYLSGEIHSDWRSKIANACEEKKLPIQFYGPELDHKVSDDCGDKILGEEKSSFWKDHKAARLNSIRNRIAMKSSDIVVVKFGDKYKQWNAAFDAGQATVMGKSLVILHDEFIDHALKEIDAVAHATCRTFEEVVEILAYTVSE